MPKKNKVRIGKAEPPKQSKKKKKDTTPQIEVKMAKDQSDSIQCTMCGKVALNKQSRTTKFLRSNSIMHRGVGGFLPVCKVCVEQMFLAYARALGDRKAAARRMCMKLDLYWNEETWDNYELKQLEKTNNPLKFGGYVNIVTMFHYRGYTFDATLDEEEAFRDAQMLLGVMGEEMGEDSDVTPEQIRLWGAGFDALFYTELDQKYAYWTEDIDTDTMDKATETLIRQICMQEVILSRDAAAGKSTEKTARLIDSLLGSLNLKPVQKEKNKPAPETEELGEATEKTPFGEWIRQIEEDRPIPEPTDEFKDVDKLKEYIETWFVGGLCNMLHIPNAYSDLFDEAMEKYTVEKPEYREDENDISLDDILEKAEEEGRKLSRGVFDADEAEDDSSSED